MLASGAKTLDLPRREQRVCRECGQDFATGQALQVVCDPCVALYREHRHPVQQRQSDYEWECKLKEAGIDPEDQVAKAMTFANTRAEWQPEAHAEARRFIDDWPNVRGLVFLGGVGSGKTHLAVAILQHFLRETDESCCYRHIPRTKYELSVAPEWRAAAQALTKPLMRAGIVVLDDFGRTTQSDADLTWLDTLIDQRWRGGYPTIITANLTAKEFVTTLGPANASRFGEGARSIQMQAKDFRRMRR